MSGESTGNDFIGSFYDLKSDARKAIPTDPDEMITELQRFVRGGWNTSRLAKFYKFQKFICDFIHDSPVKSSVAPSAFDESIQDGVGRFIIKVN